MRALIVVVSGKERYNRGRSQYKYRMERSAIVSTCQAFNGYCYYIGRASFVRIIGNVWRMCVAHTYQEAAKITLEEEQYLACVVE